jgi:hypothetical protein
MIAAPAPATQRPFVGAVAARRSNQRQEPAGLLDGELLDLYGAILIVVPVALFLKSLWM